MTNGYNERIFSGGFRAYWHQSRFRWLAFHVARLAPDYASVIELGCFDGKILRILPRRPARYLGLDANWEGGLDMARREWESTPGVRFLECHAPEDADTNGERFDLAICQETLEHLSSHLAEAYIERLAMATQRYIFITVPNEKGVPFLLKYVAKMMTGRTDYIYTRQEFMNACFGRMRRIERLEHKGFDYLETIALTRKYFEIVTLSGLPFSCLPLSLSFGIGIIGKALNTK